MNHKETEAMRINKTIFQRVFIDSIELPDA